MIEIEKDLHHFLNDQGQLQSWPAKPKKQIASLIYLAGKLEWDRLYSEQEINALLLQFHTFHDPALLRRELFMKHFLNRKPNGSSYWKTARLLPKDWKSERLIIRDALSSELSELQKIYDECAYIGALTGYHDQRENPILMEFNHETLPPHGKPELHRLQSILLQETKELVGYFIPYHGWPDPETFWIAVLAIRPSFQRQQLGKEVVDALGKEVRKLGTYSRMGISVGVGNDPAMKFWEKCEFTEILKKIDYGTHGEVWLGHKLQ